MTTGAAPVSGLVQMLCDFGTNSPTLPQGGVACPPATLHAAANALSRADELAEAVEQHLTDVRSSKEYPGYVVVNYGALTTALSAYLSARGKRR